jgi:Uma2 family endonuclease
MTAQTMSYEEFMSLPEGTFAQLIGGTLVREPAPTFRHQDARDLILIALKTHVEQRNIGRVLSSPVDVRLADNEVYQPDIIFIPVDRYDHDARHLDGAPSLVVEVLSPSTAYYDLRHKLRTYCECGVLEYWIVDPIERSIQILRSARGEFVEIAHAVGGGAVTSALIDGFSLRLDDVFRAS